MSEPREFLVAFAQALASMALYRDGHPARERTIDAAFRRLEDLRAADPSPLFTFLGEEVLYGQKPMRDFHGWEWSNRLANAGIQRLEFADAVEREEFEEFLEEMLARVTLSFVGTADARQTRSSKIRFGTVGLKGEAGETPEEDLPTATLTYSLGAEAETLRYVHDELRQRRPLALSEAEMIVGSLSVAMHSDQQLVVPLLRLRNFDEYTTTHSLNVSVLAMAVGEFLTQSAAEVRAFGMAGLLHDLGKVTIPEDILRKPGKLTPDERAVMNAHPAEGARMILETEKQLDLAAVVAYEHHIMLDGGGYPRLQYARDVHFASRVVHVCDVYDALRTNRPYREAWPSEKVLGYIDEKAGSEFDPDIARAFIRMMRLWERRLAVLETTDDAIVPGGDNGGGAGNRAVPGNGAGAGGEAGATAVAGDETGATGGTGGASGAGAPDA